PERFVAKQDRNNIQPRVGIAYAYSPKGVVRAGFGIFDDRLASSVGQVFTTAEWSSRGDLPNAALLFPGVAALPGRFRQVTAGGPAAPAAAIAFLTTGRPPASGGTSLTDNVDSNLTNPYSYQASAQVSQQLAAGFAVTVSYLFVQAKDVLGHTGNLNAVQTGTLATGKPLLAGRRFPELGNFHVTTNLGTSTYHGGSVELRKPFAHGLGFTAAYTFSRARTNVESAANLADFPESPDFSREEALSRQHVRHRGTLALTSEVPKDVPVVGSIRFSALVTLESG